MDTTAGPGRDDPPAEDIPFEVVAMVERTFGPGVCIGPAIPQPHLEDVVIPLILIPSERED